MNAIRLSIKNHGWHPCKTAEYAQLNQKPNSCEIMICVWISAMEPKAMNKNCRNSPLC